MTMRYLLLRRIVQSLRYFLNKIIFPLIRFLLVNFVSSSSVYLMTLACSAVYSAILDFLHGTIHPFVIMMWCPLTHTKLGERWEQVDMEFVHANISQLPIRGTSFLSNLLQALDHAMQLNKWVSSSGIDDLFVFV